MYKLWTKCNPNFPGVICVFLSMLICKSGQKTLQLVWMVPFSSYPEETFTYNASSSVAALALGIETVYNTSLLPGYRFNVTTIDTSCNSKDGIGGLVELLMQQDIDVVLGPPCVEEALSEQYGSRSDMDLYWLQTSTVGFLMARPKLLLHSLRGWFMAYFLSFQSSWRKLAIVSSDRDDYKHVAKDLTEELSLFNNYGLSEPIQITRQYTDIKIAATVNEIDDSLSDIIHKARIIVLVIPRNELRTYMLWAYSNGMTDGDYKFLLLDSEPVHRDDRTLLKNGQLWNGGDKNDTVFLQAIQNVLYSGWFFDVVDATEWETEAYNSYRRVFPGQKDMPEPSKPDEYSAFLHDAVLLYARALNKSLSNGTDGRASSIIEQVENGIYFKGLSGDVIFSYTTYRGANYFMCDMNSSESLQTVFERMCIVNVNETNYECNWVSDVPRYNYPSDTPVCGFFNENCTKEPGTELTSGKDNNLVVIVSVCVSGLVILVVTGFALRWRTESSLRNMTWKIPYGDLDFNLQPGKLRSSSHALRSIGGSARNNASLCGTIKSSATSVQTFKQFSTREQVFSRVALLNGDVVAVKDSTNRKMPTDRSFLLQMKTLSEIKHANLTTFVGVSVSPDRLCSIWEYCNKGSIQDVIENDHIHLDAMFKLSIAEDICKGLEYIQRSRVQYHGNLRSSKCVIDNHWVCKLTDFGTRRLKPTLECAEGSECQSIYRKLFWTAPEILRRILKKEAFENTTQADIFALGVILKELLCRSEPYCSGLNLTPKEIILKIANTPDDLTEIFRPALTDAELDSEYRRTEMMLLIQNCWAEEPENRPTAKNVLRTLKKVDPYKKTGVVDNMIAMMDKYTNNLETVVAERTEELQLEKLKTDALLYRMLPKKVAEDLKVGRTVQAEAFKSVTIYFSDIVRFTDLAGESTPLEIVGLLNALYTLFDDIISHYDVYKVETIGDAYMIASGLPQRNGILHVKEIAEVAIEILEHVRTFKIPHRPEKQLEIRIGLHTGPVVAGVVGLTMPRYCLFGDTVNTASRMESNGEPLKIHISPEMKEVLTTFSNFLVEQRGEIQIKGKGMIRTYWLTGILTDVNVCLESVPDEPPVTSDFLSETGSLTDNILLKEARLPEVFHNTLGKISVADSGICMEKYVGMNEFTVSDTVL